MWTINRWQSRSIWRLSATKSRATWGILVTSARMPRIRFWVKCLTQITPPSTPRVLPLATCRGRGAVKLAPSADAVAGNGMDAAESALKPHGQGQPLLISLALVVLFVLVWHLATVRPAFNPQGLTAEQLQKLEFNGDI